MSLLPRTEDGKINYKAMWEFKLLKGIFMFFVYLMLVIYAVAGFGSAKTWLQLRYYGGDFNIENIDQAAEKLAQKDDQMMLVQMVTRYPLEYNDIIVEKLEPLTPQLNAAYFFAIGNRYYHAGDIDEALFWTMLGRFRMRYDALRCRYETADLVSNQYSILFTTVDLLQEFLDMSAEKQKSILRRVLEWDENHPPENSPRYYCNFIEDIKRIDEIDIAPRREWETIRMIMRGAAMAHIDGDENPKAKAAE